MNLIILDYRNARAVVLHACVGDDFDACVEHWAQQNNTSADDCSWMVWDGEVEHEGVL